MVPPFPRCRECNPRFIQKSFWIWPAPTLYFHMTNICKCDAHFFRFQPDSPDLLGICQCARFTELSAFTSLDNTKFGEIRCTNLRALNLHLLCEVLMQN
ncbi:hypothetical protein FRX31_033807 [Thalictrum thalictroides]|uniref:Uncharacterized protein n=1 Tax=Thalictrum thalictroides TaxID=46969 RepID=A0A7J6UVW6_THATH|nr:hypothetical protein FRX31_033807 [Thalictrum thalictroides]